MRGLVETKSNKATIDSREVAEMMGMRHYKILEKLEGTKDGRTKGIIPVLTEGHLTLSNYFVKSKYKDAKGELRKCYLCTIDGVKAILDNTRNYISKNNLYKWYYKNTDIETSPILIHREEVGFLNTLEDVLAPFGIKGIRQYHILKYYIDYYIPSLNIAIEYDENNHKYYTYEQHKGRQIEIERELGCKFIRLNNKNKASVNIGIVLREITKGYGGRLNA